MKDRLDKFIKTEGLTPARFAEIMGVRPSSISHILGGRNKPSFDFIEKMLLRFPKLNPDWVILGKGAMYRSPENETTAASLPSTNQPEKRIVNMAPEFFTSPAPKEPTEIPNAFSSSVSQTDNITDAEIGTSPTEPSKDFQPRENRVKEPLSDPLSEKLKNEPVRNRNIDRNDSEVEQVIVFFSDKTFITYRPK